MFSVPTQLMQEEGEMYQGHGLPLLQGRTPLGCVGHCVPMNPFCTEAR